MIRIVSLALMILIVENLDSQVLISELNQYSKLEKPSFNFSDSKQKITLNGDSATLTNDSEYLIKNPKLEILKDGLSTDIEAGIAEFDKTSEKIHFRNSVYLVTSLKEEFALRSDKLSFNLNIKEISSDKPVVAFIKNVNVDSLGLAMIQNENGIKAEFNDGNIKIDNEKGLHTGYANKIIILTKLDELIMQGEAYFNQDGFVIKSDTIHYDLKKNKIIKSLNSTIENSS